MTSHSAPTSRCEHKRTLANGTPYDMEHCPIRSFAKKYPEAARKILTTPSFSASNSLDKARDNPLLRPGGTLEQYLYWRGWDLNRILKIHNLDDDDKLLQSSIGLLSHPLTFPLTLGRHIRALSRRPADVDDDVDDLSKKNRHLRLCCVGARAECTLPDDYWREFLIALFSSHQASNDLHDESFHCTIDFVGPDVPRNLKSRTLTLRDKDDQYAMQNANNKLDYDLTMNYYTSFLHEVMLEFDTVQQLMFWDGFVLFNPGFGHPNLQNQWRSTLQFLLGTSKPILVTAHSTVDAERDGEFLVKLLFDTKCQHVDRKPVQYIENPFASRMCFVDPFPASDEGVAHIVRPNHSEFLLQ